MIRSVLAGVLLLFLSLNLVLADTFKAPVKAVDEDKRTVTVDQDGKDVTYNLAKEPRIYSVSKSKKKGNAVQETSIPLTATVGKSVTVTTDKVDGKEVVISIKLEMDAKKKKKKGT